jgi:hypothetical protein
MRSPAAAIAWEFRRRNRWGLIAFACYLLVLATSKLLLLERGQSVTFDDEQSFAFAVVVPVGTTFMYFLAVFTFGFAGDLAGRRSIYPARMFTLPVTSGALAGWPMLYGTSAMAVLWLATRFLAVWPSGLDAPWIWPALLAAAILAWTQAMAWMPYALPGLRVIITVLLLTSIDVVAFLAIYYEASEPVMVALLAPHVPLAYFAARFAVASARRGDAPDWLQIFAWLGRITDLLPRRRDHFPSPARAQAWFEWRRHGRSLPALVCILLPFELSLLFLFRDTPVLVAEILIAVLFSPPFMAIFVAATVSRSSPDGSDSHELTPFIAARPLTSASLIAAKLKATIRSTLASWLLVLVAIPLALRLSGTSSVGVDGARRLIEIAGTPRAVAIGLLSLVALVLCTWKQLVQSLYIGMSGRAWLVKGSVFVTLSLLTLSVPLVPWVIRNGREAIATLWNALPWILAVLVCIKISAAAWVAIRLHDIRLLSDRTLVIGALCWDAAVLALYGLLVWLLPTMIFPSYLLALVAILAIPLVRISAAPLALSWNRHR